MRVVALMESQPRSATALVSEPGEMLLVRKADFMRLIKEPMSRDWVEKDRLLKLEMFLQDHLVGIREHAKSFVPITGKSHATHMFAKKKYLPGHIFLHEGQVAEGALYVIFEGSVEFFRAASGTTAKLREAWRNPVMEQRKPLGLLQPTSAGVVAREYRLCAMLSGGLFGSASFIGGEKTTEEFSVIAGPKGCLVFESVGDNFQKLPLKVASAAREVLSKVAQVHQERCGVLLATLDSGSDENPAKLWKRTMAWQGNANARRASQSPRAYEVAVRWSSGMYSCRRDAKGGDLKGYSLNSRESSPHFEQDAGITSVAKSVAPYVIEKGGPSTRQIESLAGDPPAGGDWCAVLVPQRRVACDACKSDPGGSECTSEVPEPLEEEAAVQLPMQGPWQIKLDLTLWYFTTPLCQQLESPNSLDELRLRQTLQDQAPSAGWKCFVFSSLAAFKKPFFSGCPGKWARMLTLPGFSGEPLPASFQHVGELEFPRELVGALMFAPERQASADEFEKLWADELEAKGEEKASVASVLMRMVPKNKLITGGLAYSWAVLIGQLYSVYLVRFSLMHFFKLQAWVLAHPHEERNLTNQLLIAIFAFTIYPISQIIILSITNSITTQLDQRMCGGLAVALFRKAQRLPSPWTQKKRVLMICMYGLNTWQTDDSTVGTEQSSPKEGMLPMQTAMYPHLRIRLLNHDILTALIGSFDSLCLAGTAAMSVFVLFFLMASQLRLATICAFGIAIPCVSYAVVLGGGIGEVMLMLQERTDRRVVTLREVLFGAGSPDSTLSSSWLQLGSEHGAEVRVVKCYGWEVAMEQKLAALRNKEVLLALYMRDRLRVKKGLGKWEESGAAAMNFNRQLGTHRCPSRRGQGITALLVAFPRLLIWPRPDEIRRRFCGSELETLQTLAAEPREPRAGLVGYAAIYGAHDVPCLDLNRSVPKTRFDE
ncbi:UFGT, partial [Symbiodinium necroappetens]